MLDVEANRKLAELGIAAKIDLERSELKLAQLNKQLERNRFRLASFIKMQQLEKQQQHMRLVAEQQNVANLADKIASLTIKAGIAGTLEKLDIELGQYVNAGQTLAKVGSSTDLIAKIRIPQRLAEKVQLDARVNIKSKDSILNGKISQLSSVIRDGFVLAEVKILDPLPNYIRPALNLTADVFIEQKNDALFIKQAPGVQPLSKKNLYQLTDDSVAEQLEITFSERLTEHDVSTLNIDQSAMPLEQQRRQSQNDVIRILSHEIRNSLTPIASMSDTLLTAPDLPYAQQQEVLERIKKRSESLLDFIHSYAMLSHLPDAKPIRINLAKLCEQQAANLAIPLSYQGEHFATVDPMLFEQLLINLFKNAQQANPNTQLSCHCYYQDQQYILEIADQGPGFANLNNALNPLFTTKVNGQGLGLTLCRDIMNLHQGNIVLSNHSTGALVTLSWP